MSGGGRDDTAGSPLAERRGIFGWVLLTVVASTIVVVSVPDRAVAAALAALLLGGALSLVFVAGGASTRVRRLGLAAWGLISLLSVAAVVADSDRAPVVPIALSFLMVITAIGVIARRLGRLPAIDRTTVFVALSVYLLIGQAFAYLLSLVGLLTGWSVFVGQPDPSLQDTVYFAYVTLTTVGYGDLVPGSQITRALAIGEALLGQLYLVSVVALVIGNLGRQRPSVAERTGEPGREGSRAGPFQ